ncbi:helix-turn-helix transcriptional regulator [Mesorhizobium sp. KR9-304]|uniref:helix-turn-helix transcriptional regulator n=1 Tax=Mesorhizobium sp. KR9-304 TaxID=3156614 RepID=UPI0032B3A871
MAERRPADAFAGLVSRMVGYREIERGHFRQVEAASLDIPLVVSFGEPFAIGLGRAPGSNDRYGSFAAGLFAGPVTIDSFGASNCIQINFTPLGARRFFGMPMTELTDRIVVLDDLLGAEGAALREALGDAPDWERRFDIAESFVLPKVAGAHAPSPEVAWAFRTITATGGRARVASIARGIGWSRKHLARRFATEVGLGPKSVSRIVRLNRAIAAARTGDGGWASIAADCGYADQAHLVREFRELAGASPTAWGIEAR